MAPEVGGLAGPLATAEPYGGPGFARFALALAEALPGVAEERAQKSSSRRRSPVLISTLGIGPRQAMSALMSPTWNTHGFSVSAMERFSSKTLYDVDAFGRRVAH
jgi:hypothetical protein